MQDSPWCLIDTETTGLHSPIFVVEIAAQRMRGWEPNGLPFRRLVNHGLDIPPEAARVHGYTREILERDGDDPAEVYRDFARYAHDLPIAAYNLSYDWDEVLLPEWQRLGLAPVGKRGLCCLELARRLLDPVPAGNSSCKRSGSTTDSPQAVPTRRWAMSRLSLTCCNGCCDSCARPEG